MSAPAKLYALAMVSFNAASNSLPVGLPRARLARYLDRIAHDDTKLGEGEIDSHAVPRIDRAIARRGHREGNDGTARAASDHDDTKSAFARWSRRDVGGHGDAEILPERGDRSMRRFRASAIAPPFAGACSANETEAEAAQHPRKRLGVVMPRDHRTPRDHRRVDARKQ